MLVFVTGATGLIGGRVVERLRERGDRVIALSRQPRAATGGGCEWVTGDLSGEQGGEWQERLAGTEAVVHLAGEPLDGARWTPAYKEKLRSGRVDGTSRLVEAIARVPAPRRPRVLAAASAVGFYGPRGEELLDESSPPGSDFLATLARDWEEATLGARAASLRAIPLRFGVVLSARGGALVRMLPAFKLMVGGPLGRPDAWFPWIHEDDAAGLVLHALDRPIDGPMNAVAPEAVRMRDFARAVGAATRRPSLFRVPQLALNLLLGEMGEIVNPGQRVLPRAAQATGYRFVHERLDGALAAVLGRAGRPTPG